MTTLIVAEYDGKAYNFQADGWFNATLAASRYEKKRPAEWLRLPETKRYLDALCNRSKVGKSHFVKTHRGGNAKEPGFAGTWLHPKLAVRFSQWLDIDFAIWCDEQIDEILRGSKVSPDAAVLSTVADRTGLFLSAVFSVVRHRLGFATVYRAFNDAAGAANFRSMTRAQVRQAEPVAQRIANGTATPQDWLLIEANRPDKQIAQRQAELSFSPGAEPK
jgi:hypothetical protein